MTVQSALENEETMKNSHPVQLEARVAYAYAISVKSHFTWLLCGWCEPAHLLQLPRFYCVDADALLTLVV